MRWCFLLAVVLTTPALAQTESPLASDVSSPEAIVRAAYDVIQRPPGEPYQWERWKSLFIPEAVQIPNTEQRGGAFVVYTGDGFQATVDSFTVVGGPSDRGFAEEELHQVVHRYGDIAQVFSTYQKRYWDDDRILGRGINSFQLVFNEDRWWIVSIVWDEENGAGPIPAAYLGEVAPPQRASSPHRH